METISLIGFMGSGKTSVGKELAKLLPGHELIDLDSYIEAVTGRSIPEIFKTDGEAAFREMERAALEDIFMTGEMLGTPYILSLGGGTVMTEACRRIIRKKTRCVYLRGKVDTLVHNLETWPGDRPLLQSGSDLRARVTELLGLRSKTYESAAHHIIDIDGKDYLPLALEILDAVEQV